MPSQTFQNLPGAKRSRIVELAIEEFAQWPFAEASLSRIVSRAKIAKGSFYQYFDSKLDLYRWLVQEELPRRKLAAMQNETAAIDPSDLGAFLRALVLSGIHFMLANPTLAQLAAHVSLPSSNPQLQALHNGVREQGLAGFVQLLGAARSRGQLRSDVELESIARLLSVVLTHGLRDIVLARLGVDLQQHFLAPAAAVPIDERGLDSAVAEAVDLVLHGVAPRPR